MPETSALTNGTTTQIAPGFSVAGQRRNLSFVVNFDVANGRSSAAQAVGGVEWLGRAVLALDRSFTIAAATLPDSPLVFVNPAFERITGYSAGEVVGRNCRFLQGPDTDAGTVAILREAVRGGQAATVTLLNYRKDGSTFWNEVSMTPLHDTDGAVTHFVGVQVDVTAQVTAKQELEAVYASERRAHAEARRAMARLQAVLDQLPLGVLVAEADGEISSASVESRRMLGDATDLAPAVAPEPGRYTGHHGDGRALALADWPLARSLRRGEVVSDEEIVIRRPDGTEAVMLARSTPIRGDDGDVTAAVVVFSDITQRKAAERELGEARERLAELATTLQSSLLPPELPIVKGIEFGAAYSPAGEGLEVGGDFYDVYEHRDGEWVMVIGDVMGKGAEAATVTSLARHALRTVALRARRPSTMLTVLNQALLSEGAGRRFCTVATAVLTQIDGGAQLSLGLGGHPRPFLVRASGHVQPIGQPGTLMGVLPVVQLTDVDVDLGPGDIVVLFTDGVTEAHVGDDFLGEDGLRRVLERLARGGTSGLSAPHLAHEVQEEALRFQGELKDDLAVLVVKVLPTVRSRRGHL